MNVKSTSSKTTKPVLTFDQQLNKQQQRRSSKRLSNLKTRLENKYPLFMDELMERELTEHKEYLDATPTLLDVQVLQFKNALKINPKSDIHNFVQDDYLMSGINQSYSAMAYRALCEKVVCPLEFLRYSSNQFYTYRSKPHYRADYWYQILIKLGFKRDYILNIVK